MFRRLAISLGLTLAFTASALAWGAAPSGVITLNPQVNAPAGSAGLPPINDDFSKDGYPVAGGRCSEWGRRVPCTNHVSLVRASTATNLQPTSESGFAYSTWAVNQFRQSANRGALIEEARTNQLFNSTAPVTQTTGSLANGTYTLWINGSGSAQMSSGTATGCGTGTATNGTPVNFTTTGAAGTCTVTVTGSLNAFQLELGAFGTSLIVTAGATATRAADVPTLIGPASLALNRAASAFAQTNGLPGTAGRIFDTGAVAGNLISLYATLTASRILPLAGTSAQATLGSGTIAGTVKNSFGFNADSLTNIANGGVKATTLTPIFTIGSSPVLGNVAAANAALNGYMQHFALSPMKGVFDGATAP